MITIIKFAFDCLFRKAFELVFLFITKMEIGTKGSTRMVRKKAMGSSISMMETGTKESTRMIIWKVKAFTIIRVAQDTKENGNKIE
jgi:hypothetical protein